jgi:hypothetical protein
MFCWTEGVLLITRETPSCQLVVVRGKHEAGGTHSKHECMTTGVRTPWEPREREHELSCNLGLFRMQIFVRQMGIGDGQPATRIRRCGIPSSAAPLGCLHAWSRQSSCWINDRRSTAHTFVLFGGSWFVNRNATVNKSEKSGLVGVSQAWCS